MRFSAGASPRPTVRILQQMHTFAAGDHYVIVFRKTEIVPISEEQVMTCPYNETFKLCDQQNFDFCNKGHREQFRVLQMIGFSDT